MSKGRSVFGSFPTIEGARLAVDRLVDAGIARERLGLLISPEARRRFPTLTNHTNAGEGAAASGIAGDAPGGMLGGLSKVAALAAPGVGLPAAEPLVSMLPGAGVGAPADGTFDGPIDHDTPESGIQGANEVLTKEGVLVTLSVDDKQLVETAERLLDEAGATLVRTSEASQPSYPSAS